MDEDLKALSDEALAARLTRINAVRDQLTQEARTINRIRLKRTTQQRLRDQVSHLPKDDKVRLAVEEALANG